MIQNTNPYRSLEDRTTNFAKQVARLCQELPKNVINLRYIDQIIRSSGSVGANYQEANEAISKKDFLHRLRIARKEAKETSYWLELIQNANPQFTENISSLSQETIEIRNILSTIIYKSSVPSSVQVCYV